MDAVLTPELMLRAYTMGIFPMSEGRDDPEVFWVDPKRRGILPLDGFHISRSLGRRIRQEPYLLTVNEAFDSVVSACADRDETWINPTIQELYSTLYRAGFAQSQEVWDGPELVGGVYGVTIGAAFFGESMFSKRRDASKIALAYLVDRLRMGGFQLFDTQFVTPHLVSLGAQEISRAAYREKLEAAIEADADFYAQDAVPDGYSVLQRNTQTS
ncbi:leucyl/phenylalanyl-tRNA--protein transferase [Cognatishimia sp. MH4019]|uniref:leucyl/phenylalanyl-tRNA--protein transferase n=1 Tax=Cognatishimia sp. MH4019 TaxID=2854030 RepID=UPI001CD442FD|nr:leucyl/phenylalanyl-tRNA--protein transferase [Cognatishimia sp. MH4019]